MDLKNLTIKKAHELLKKKELTSVELTELFLKNIKEKDGDIHAKKRRRRRQKKLMKEFQEANRLKC